MQIDGSPSGRTDRTETTGRHPSVTAERQFASFKNNNEKNKLILWLDRETFNKLDLKVVGLFVYAQTAEDLIVAYAIDDEPVQAWDVTEDPMCPPDLWHALQHADEVWAHNAQFDGAIHEGPNQRALPQVEPHRWRCSAAMARSHALPGALDDLCRVLKVPADLAKMEEGKALIKLFTQPRPANQKIQRATRLTHPAEWATFVLYAKNDVSAMRECVRRMPRWNWDDDCVAEWHCDQRINARGFAVDQVLTAAGARAAIVEKARIGVRFRELTGGVVDRPSLRKPFMAYLNERFGLRLDNTQGETFQTLIKEGGLPKDCVELMQLSIAANKTSTAKYAKLVPMVNADGRFRGALMFAGASRTRRWAGRGPQFHNLPSRGLPKVQVVADYIEHLKAGVHDLFHDDLMKLGTAALRGVVISPPGKKLIAADLSNIEGRVLAWLADEEWKLQAFRDYDAGIGPDLYNITATSIIGGDPWNVPKADRNVFGKVPDLASGYQGGVAGYQTFAKAYGVKMADHWETIQKMIAPEHVSRARWGLANWGKDQPAEMEISEIEWLASETCKQAWRARHPKTQQLWKDLETACKNAINQWGTQFSIGRHLKVKCVNHKDQKWMVIRLPSGRYLTYFNPRITSNAQISYEGEAAEEGSTTRHWVRVITHGGKIAGNCCQTIARDILMPALPAAERAGYTPILSVHDEIITETPDTDEFTEGGLVKILAASHAWTKGLPLAAAGFEAYRYKKED